MHLEQDDTNLKRDPTPPFALLLGTCSKSPMTDILIHPLQGLSQNNLRFIFLCLSQSIEIYGEPPILFHKASTILITEFDKPSTQKSMDQYES